MLDATDFLLVNPWQRGFPLVPHPFEAIARKAGVSEEEAISRLARLREQGVIDRIGPVFRPNTVGASTLAALAVPPARLAAVARFVSDQSGVNHNYERTHRYNLWFVVTGASEPEVQWTLACIEHGTGLKALRLPLLEEFHIDLAFDLDSHAAPRTAGPREFPPLSAAEQKVVAAVVGGLPLVRAPYAEAAKRAGMAEAGLLSLLGTMLADGRIRRIGAVIRHRRLGYEANAMAVWDVPDASVAERGRGLAHEPAVTLCYRRARALPDWPYNLFCMIHGRERARVLEEVGRLAGLHGLAAFPHAVLFSTRCFSQRAAKYG